MNTSSESTQLDTDYEDVPARRPIPYFVGWGAVIAAIVPFSLVVVAVRTWTIVPELARMLLFSNAPVAILLLTGGLGLIYQRAFGVYVTSAVALFGSIGGLKLSLIPLWKRFFSIGIYTDDLIVVTNLAIILLLAWDHIAHFNRSNPVTAPRHKTLAVALLALGLAWVGWGRMQIDKESGTVPNALALPVLGEQLAALETQGPVHFRLVNEHLRGGITLVFSGYTTVASAASLADEHALKPLAAERRHKALPQVKSWGLPEAVFPREFGPSDSCYTGYLDPPSRLIFQLCVREEDGQFTAQIMGIREGESSHTADDESL